MTDDVLLGNYQVRRSTHVQNGSVPEYAFV